MNTEPIVQPAGDPSGAVQPEMITITKEEHDNLLHVQASQSGSDKAAVRFKAELDLVTGKNKELELKVESLLSEDQLKEHELQKKSDKEQKTQKELDELKSWRVDRDIEKMKLNVLKELDISDLDFLELPGVTKEDFTAQVAAWKVKLDKQEEITKTGIMNQSAPPKGATGLDNLEMKRSDFDSLDQTNKALVMKKGTKLIE